MEILFLIGRVLYGGFFLLNGLNHLRKSGALAVYAQSKGVAAPKLAVLGSGLLILLGGLGILAGVYIEWAVLCIALFLLPVSFKMHNFWAVAEPGAKMAERINFLKNMALLGAALALLAIPAPWPFSLF